MVVFLLQRILITCTEGSVLNGSLEMTGFSFEFVMKFNAE